MAVTTQRPTDSIPPLPESDSTPDLRPAKFGALQSSNFRLLWLGLFISNAGTWMATTAEGWLVTDLEPGRAPFWLGAISAAFAIPMILLPPFGGALADRVDRMRLLWITQFAFLALSLTLAGLAITNNVNVYWLVALSAAMGVILAFDSPVRHALLPDLVPKADLTSAVSLNSVTFTGAALVGPAVAGLLIPAIGTDGVFVVRAFLSVGTLVALALMTDVPNNLRIPSANNVLQSIADGIRFLFGDPLLRGLILVSLATSVLGRSYAPLLAVYARDEFNVSSQAFGLLVAAGGLGTLAGALALASRRSVDSMGHKILAASLVQAVTLLLLALTPWYWPAIPMQAVIGAAGAVTAALVSTLLQLNSPQQLRGRVMSLYMMTLVGMPSIGALVVGIFANQTSVRIAMASCAILLIIALAVIARTNATVRNI